MTPAETFAVSPVSKQYQALYDKVCIHHGDKERAEMSCPICLKAERNEARKLCNALVAVMEINSPTRRVYENGLHYKNRRAAFFKALAQARRRALKT